MDDDIDPNVAWKLTVAIARTTHQAVEVCVEYQTPSPHAGRRARLAYDPVTDKETFEWLDN